MKSFKNNSARDFLGRFFSKYLVPLLYRETVKADRLLTAFTETNKNSNGYFKSKECHAKNNFNDFLER